MPIAHLQRLVDEMYRLPWRAVRWRLARHATSAVVALVDATFRHGGRFGTTAAMRSCQHLRRGFGAR